MRSLGLLIIFCSKVVLASTFSPDVHLCTYLLKDDREKFLLFNFKTRSQVQIKLKGKELDKLDKGPYLFDLRILNPLYKKNVYEAEILNVSKCIPDNVVRFVDGELRERK